MKLTKMMRETFVRAVLADVPKINYREKFNKLFQSFALAALPKPAFDLYKTHPDFFKTQHQSIGCWGILVVGYDNFTLNVDQKKQLTDIYDLDVEQTRSREKLENEISAVAQSCSTLKQLHEVFPELLKYMPSELLKGESFSLVAANNVVSSLVKAGLKIK